MARVRTLKRNGVVITIVGVRGISRSYQNLGSSMEAVCRCVVAVSEVYDGEGRGLGAWKGGREGLDRLMTHANWGDRVCYYFSSLGTLLRVIAHDGMGLDRAPR